MIQDWYVLILEHFTDFNRGITFLSFLCTIYKCNGSHKWKVTVHTVAYDCVAKLVCQRTPSWWHLFVIMIGLLLLKHSTWFSFHVWLFPSNWCFAYQRKMIMFVKSFLDNSHMSKLPDILSMIYSLLGVYCLIVYTCM